MVKFNQLYKRFKFNLFNFSILSLIILFNLSYANATEIDDDLNYIKKAEDYDQVCIY